MEDQGTEHIIIMVDLDEDSCITETKNNIVIGANHHVVVSVKEFENWYLADHIALSSLINRNVDVIEFPEREEEPVAKIIELNNGKGFGGSKPRLAMKMRSNGFSIEKAANHPNCPSALYFLDKLKSIN